MSLHEQRITDITFYQSGNRPAARYVSGTTVYEEALDHTRWLGLYWSASGQVQRENVVSALPEKNPLEHPLHAFSLEIDGQDLRNRWEWVGAYERPGAHNTREAVVELRHQVRPVTVRVVTRLDGTPILVRWLEVTNTSLQPTALSAVAPWSGMLWNSGEHLGFLLPETPPFTLGYLDALAWGTEGNFVWEPVPRGGRRIASTSGRSGWGAPYFLLKNEMTGECAVGGLAWSGNWSLDVWRDPYRDYENRPSNGENLSFAMSPDGVAPLRMLAPGETVHSPRMHLGLVRDGITGCVTAMHHHLRASVIPPMPVGREMHAIAARVVEGPDAWIFHEIDIATEMGCEAFMVDAGWYGDAFGDWWDRRGDWWEGSWLPGGLETCRTRCHQHGMRFGLWIEPENAGPQSRLLQEHPEWMMRTDGEREIAAAAEGGFLDLSHPEAAAYVEESILRVIHEYQLDFLKLDYNVRTLEGGQRERDGFLEHEAWRHCECLYAIFDRVRREYPDLVLENCAGGGGRNDLGMLARFHYSCESDMSDFPRSIRAIAGWTTFIPPESLVYYHNHLPTAHQKTDLDTHLRVTLFARTIFVGFGAQDADRGTSYFETTRRYIALGRSFAKPLLANHPRVFHHTQGVGTQGPADWCVLEYAAQDCSTAMVGLFRLGAHASQEWIFHPRGLDPARRYRVTLDNVGVDVELSGTDILLHGLPVRLETVNSSELLLFRAM